MQPSHSERAIPKERSLQQFLAELKVLSDYYGVYVNQGWIAYDEPRDWGYETKNNELWYAPYDS